MTDNEKAPTILTQEHIDFLDALRASGVVNMFGARPYLVEVFDLDQKTAKEILITWMRTFKERQEES